MHGLFRVFCRLFERLQQRLYIFAEEQCKSTSKASELCSPAFKGVQTRTRVSITK